ncbi:MAG TPA: penicillin-binding transpeptidase domain-containing protein [Planctomycetota bacterium]|nr:penicillin-binding transpeptidase domain-containing protein [Planctomycetota bacterium]
MKAGELARVRFAFGLLGAVPVFLIGWLGWLQLAHAGTIDRGDRAPLRLLPATADRQARRSEIVPAPRGTIVDRHGSVLAIDCETYEVRARIVVPKKHRASVEAFRAWLRGLVDELTLALVVDPELADRAEARRQHQERLRKVLARAFELADLPATGPLPAEHPVRADVLVAADVDVLSVVEALRDLATRNDALTFDFLRDHHRVYPDREFTYGLVGHTDTSWAVMPGATTPSLHTFGVCGLESFLALEPDEAAVRRFLKDGSGQPYFLAPLDEPHVPTVLHTTIDIELQRTAVRELTRQAEAGAREGDVRIPKWGALVLVEIATGDIVAAASWHRDEKRGQVASFTPYQSLFEPGSIVKPLVFAYALEAGVVDWSHEYDCSPGGATYRELIGSLGRASAVRDDHTCGVLTPHGIIVNSSNIGASYVGLGLDREQWRDYMRFYGVGTSLGLNLPHEHKGGPNRHSFDAGISVRSFRANSAISFSFGYELSVTAMHVARAYLRIFRGGAAELRLCRGVELDGRWYAAPAPAGSGARFRPEVVEAVRAAMVDVVSDEPHATGFKLHGDMLKEQGIDLHGFVAGKTGTAASDVGIPDRGKVNVRNASFVGFVPADAPRWLAVCVLQKDDSARFYGGSYAAPPAVRLLLQAKALEDRRGSRQEPLRSDASNRSAPVSGAADGLPGDSGWSVGLQGQRR